MVADKMVRSKWYGFGIRVRVRVRVRVKGRVRVRGRIRIGVSKIVSSYHSDTVPFCPRTILS